MQFWQKLVSYSRRSSRFMADFYLYSFYRINDHMNTTLFTWCSRIHIFLSKSFQYKVRLCRLACRSKRLIYLLLSAPAVFHLKGAHAPVRTPLDARRGDVWKTLCFGFYLSAVFIYVSLKSLIWDVTSTKGKTVINL